MEKIQDLIQAIEDGKPVDAEAIFGDEMLDRVQKALEIKKNEISQRIFSQNGGLDQDTNSEEE